MKYVKYHNKLNLSLQCIFKISIFTRKQNKIFGLQSTRNQYKKIFPAVQNFISSLKDSKEPALLDWREKAISEFSL